MAIFKPADILIPQNVDFTKWSVVACDQYTSEREYWEDVKNIVGDSPSTLNIIFPEVYLEDGDGDERIKKINSTMEEYINKGIFRKLNDTFIYVKRTQPNGKTRHGIVGMLDLEEYDFSKGSQSKVRATEGTIIERIPPRQRIRKNAPLEAPHILILIDDREKAVVEPLENQINDFEKIYDFDLMKNSGHIVGYNVNESAKKNILDAIEKLGDKADFEAKYGVKDKGVLMFAAGDGNHSLAAAKEYYEQLKAAYPDEDFSDHPARYALVEIVNLHSPALQFEAIHRIVTDVDVEDLLSKMSVALHIKKEGKGQTFYTIYKGKKKKCVIDRPTSKLTVGSLQRFLDSYLAQNGGKIDYIHGEDVVEGLAKEKNSIGFILPDMGKEELFPTVIHDGALPRKTFSMGHAQDKRYYTECRKIRK